MTVPSPPASPGSQRSLPPPLLACALGLAVLAASCGSPPQVSSPGEHGGAPAALGTTTGEFREGPADRGGDDVVAGGRSDEGDEEGEASERSLNLPLWSAFGEYCRTGDEAHLLAARDLLDKRKRSGPPSGLEVKRVEGLIRRNLEKVPLEEQGFDDMQIVGLDYVEHVMRSQRLSWPLQEEFAGLTQLIEGDYDLGRFDEPWRGVVEGLLEPGARVVDVGCGRFPDEPWLAERVGPSGRVYAVDILGDVVDYHDFLARHPRSRSFYKHPERVQAIRCAPADVSLPPEAVGRIDLLLMKDVRLAGADPEGDPRDYQERIVPWLESMLRALRPGGLLVVTEREPREVPPSWVASILGPAGFEPRELLREDGGRVTAEEALESRYVYVFRVP